MCAKPLDPRWKICPYCEAEVGQAPAEPRRTRPRRAAAAGQARQSAPRARRPASRPAAGGRHRRAARPGSARAPSLRRLMERTLILVKPDAFERSLTGEILARFERKGLTIAAMKHMLVERELAEQHYDEHSEKPFFESLVDFITSGHLVALVLEGHEAITAARQVIGATNPARGLARLDQGRVRPRGPDEPRPRL